MVNEIYHYIMTIKPKGSSRLYSFLKKNKYPYEIKFKTAKGFLMSLDPYNYIDSIIIKEGYYESEVLDCLLFDCKPEACFWDIGANIGLHSIAFKFQQPNSKVISFEPDFKNFDRLKKNCALNKLQIDLMNFPLSNQLGINKLFNIEGNHGMSTIAPWHEFKYNTLSHYVFCVSGDFLTKNNCLPVPDIIKIDVEGFELEVINGLQETLNLKKTKKIVFEASSKFMSEQSELKSVLISLGYNFERLARNESTEHSLGNFLAFL